MKINEIQQLLANLHNMRVNSHDAGLAQLTIASAMVKAAELLEVKLAQEVELNKIGMNKVTDKQ